MQFNVVESVQLNLSSTASWGTKKCPLWRGFNKSQSMDCQEERSGGCGEEAVSASSTVVNKVVVIAKK